MVARLLGLSARALASLATELSKLLQLLLCFPGVMASQDKGQGPCSLPRAPMTVHPYYEGQKGPLEGNRTRRRVGRRRYAEYCGVGVSHRPLDRYCISVLFSRANEISALYTEIEAH
ncbi:hypothetical protein GGR56DRAFT_431799 [Xylariaceae sp. FL0804]|nr:hypothetical protein GGR56DRAFT_431799 [Xylariaceae sp. FL0804]